MLLSPRTLPSSSPGRFFKARRPWRRKLSGECGDERQESAGRACGDLSNQPAAPRAPALINCSIREKKRDAIIQNFRKSKLGGWGNTGLYRLPLPLASPNVGALTTAHPAGAEGGFLPFHPQTELFTKFPQTELLRKARQIELKFH